MDQQLDRMYAVHPIDNQPHHNLSAKASNVM